MRLRFSSPALIAAVWLSAGDAAYGAAQDAGELARLTKALPGAPTKAAPRPSKLDPGLEAIARAWRRLGSRGAEREAAARQVPLRAMRLAAVIRVTDAGRRPEVERAIKKAWGEVVWAREASVSVELPVHAIRRISRMSAVESVSLDEQLAPAAPAIEPSKETPR